LFGIIPKYGSDQDIGIDPDHRSDLSRTAA
jgi:hypothetical protein